MQYQQSLSIEQRLEEILQLIRTGEYSTPELSEHVGVSVPTVSRCIRALRDRGYSIQANKTSAGWIYTLSENRAASSRNRRTIK